MKRIWQSWMIALARAPGVTRWMQGNRAAGPDQRISKTQNPVPSRGPFLRYSCV